MPSRKIAFVRGQYYHIFNRGIDRSTIFFTDENYRHCLRLVKNNSQKHNISVTAYCLMPNHYHFWLRQDGELPISKFIGVVFNAYAQAINKQRERQGPLFEGRFSSVLVDKDEYLTHLCRYIHMNPVKAGLVATPDKWMYSNYLDWIGLRPGTIIDKEFISTNFGNPAKYRDFVESEFSAEEERSKIKQYMLD